MVNVVLCGGSGTRLWPLSRSLYPKQFIKLFDNKSLFQLTVLRNKEFAEKFIFVTNESHYFLALDQIEEIGLSMNNVEFILEPVGKNTAPAVAFASFMVEQDQLVLVSSADHYIKASNNYYESLKKAKELAKLDYIVTFGIKPTSPNTGYGYIKADGFNVLEFKEKPDLETAKRYIEDGNYFWNSGIFCFKAKTYLEELNLHEKEIFELSYTAWKNAKNCSPVRIKIDDMLKIESKSIDYAVAEKSKKLKIVPFDIDWNDLGSFDSLYEVLEKDQNGNTRNNSILINSKNNLIIEENSRTIGAIDVEDLIIVDTADALLISKKGSGQKVKDIVSMLKTKNSELTDAHLTVYRPWGNYTLLEQNRFYKIKKIVVKPQKRLSLQKHLHRSEHWIVVSGTAQVSVGDKEFILRPNESTYIKIGELHRLENPGKIDLVIIEAQVGEYVGEDDIIRVEDDFKRC
ncbi:MAG: mannose-1-phosphate guanylyltransferase/mannose-6-phosphate isomerase [Desulfurella sp.]|jgi:mannose-1-phosphate guanylyltransferase|uniref:mannose-1-phosphate guanylyltransferase n=1 Tax=Desulfurella multipotens TaxID=79269 RepID=A0A1G6K696_9BACT|nr:MULTISPECIES: mannose-1-phosphate guanylyltransferase/mannose-6-phosphate isomerase [Desulfurella]AHF97098.1 mannose-1-phosphate guanylyltransferase [Desulfurella acetivorans A63]HEX13120.1 mannose-1-phosphate guanylyltransferase/mannose-6-phosphate isomerase [Desulfurella acetivorans]PMP65523.1 MAG: mannose-1-phosphate guanylyltransferase/mannose-6-phosphate isomerase [Desulfurella multipotens]PMP87894.1 MAG: mannose-1-phosphate guanylyltransferase/mannose-6-phosphate isomerase [Desulfurell